MGDVKKLSKTQENTSKVETPSKKWYNISCENCVAWKVLEGPQDLSNGIVGECRIRAPIITQDDEGFPLTMFPIVESNVWCCEFKAKN